jgi:mannose-1-phosphate guanylyltransferase
MYSHIAKIGESIGTTQFPYVFAEEFQKIQGKSIDYAVMERYSDVLVMQAPFAWDDVGSWQSLARLGQSDNEGNTAQGKFLNIDSKDMIIRSEGDHLIVTIGMNETIVVHTPDATLVAPKNQEERVREVVKRLEAAGMISYL